MYLHLHGGLQAFLNLSIPAVLKAIVSARGREAEGQQLPRLHGGVIPSLKQALSGSQLAIQDLPNTSLLDLKPTNIKKKLNSEANHSFSE